MPSRRFELTIPEELWDRLTEARGHETAASFIKRALESALGEQPSGAPPPASSRASAEFKLCGQGCEVPVATNLKRCIKHGLVLK